MHEGYAILANRGRGIATDVVEATPGSLRLHTFSRRRYLIALAPWRGMRALGFVLLFLLLPLLGSVEVSQDPFLSNRVFILVLVVLLVSVGLLSVLLSLAERHFVARWLLRRPLRTADIRALGAFEDDTPDVLVTDGVQTFWLYLEGPRRRAMAALATARAPPLPIFLNPRRFRLTGIHSWSPIR